MKTQLWPIKLFASVMLGPAPVAIGQAGDAAQHTRADLIPEVESIQPGVPFWVGVRLTMDAKWHTYWLNPGDSGYPTSVHWDLPTGFTAGPIVWPTPGRFEAAGSVIYGYGDEVMLLVQITPAADVKVGDTVVLRADADWLECDEVCVPGRAKITASLPVKDTAPKAVAAHAKRFTAARAALPATKTDWTFSAWVSDTEIVVDARAPRGRAAVNKTATFFPETEALVDITARTSWTATAAGYRLRLRRSTLYEGDVKRVQGVLVGGAGWDGPDAAKSVRIDAAATPGSPRE